MKSRFPESKEERAIRLLQEIGPLGAPAAGTLESNQMGALASPAALEKRIADRLKQARPDASMELIDVLACKAATDAHQTALRLRSGASSLSDLTTDSLANLEAVIRVSGRPAWFVRNGAPQMQGPSPTDAADAFWIAFINAKGKALLQGVCSRVGCMMKQEDGNRKPIGTSWLINDRTLITNAHVAGHIAFQNVSASSDARGGWRLKPDCQGLVDFSFENGVKSKASSFAIEQVLYVETSQEPDIAVFRISVPNGGPAPPAPLGLDLTAARAAGWNDTAVFALGHPIADLADDSNVALVFGHLDGTKRMSPGKLKDVLGNAVLTHDCATTNGSSGSPLVDFGSLKAVGLHYFGKPGDRNEAVFLPAIAEHPAIVKSLSGAWGL